jgi:hypothetical protein
MIFAPAGWSDAMSGGASCIATPRRSKLARKSGSLIMAAMDKSSWVSIDCLYVFSVFRNPVAILLARHFITPLSCVNGITIVLDKFCQQSFDQF